MATLRNQPSFDRLFAKNQTYEKMIRNQFKTQLKEMKKELEEKFQQLFRILVQRKNQLMKQLTIIEREFDEQLIRNNEYRKNLEIISSTETTDFNQNLQTQLDKIKLSDFPQYRQVKLAMEESLPYTLANTGRILISKADPPQPYKIIPYGRSLINFNPFDVQTDRNGLTYVLNLSGDTEIIVFNNEGEIVDSGSLIRATTTTDIQLGGITVSDKLVYVSIGSYNQIQVYDKPKIAYIQSIGRLGAGQGEFNQPVGMACIDDYLIVCEWGNNRLQVLRNGIFSHFLGHTGEIPGSLRRPKSVAISLKQEIIVLHNGTPGINIYQLEGCLISQISSQSPHSELDGCGTSISVGRNGEIVVTYSNRGCVAVFDPKRNYCLEFGGNGYEYGKFNRPLGVYVNKENSIVVCDTDNNRLQWFLLDNIIS